MKTTHRLLLSLGGGILVAGFSYFYLRNAEKKIHAQQKMATILVARRFIPTGKPVKPDDVEERSIPEAYIQPMAVLSLKGLSVRSRRGVAKGEQITRSNIYEEGTLLGLSWALTAGKSAATLLLPPEKAVGGFLAPGDRVDVICSMDRQPGWEEAAAFPLFSHVRVLAVNDRTVDAPVSSAGEKREMSNDSILVTLELPLELAARLALAEEKGRLTLALISPLDTEVHSALAVSLRGLKR